VKTQTGNQGHHALPLEVSEGRYRVLFDYAPDGILIANVQGYYLDANPRMCEMLGYSREELVKLHSTDIVAPSEQQYVEPVLDEVLSTNRHQRLWSFQRKDGTLFDAEVFVTTMPDGNLLGMVRDVSESMAREREITRLSNLYEALSRINHAIVTRSTRTELLQTICQILVEQGGLSMAWASWHNADTQQLEPIAVAGDDAGYIRTIKIYADERPEGMGPSGMCFRTGEPFICNDMQHNPITLPWRDEILRRNFKASAAFPIRQEGAVRGVLNVYSDRTEFFHQKEIALLLEASSDTAFALDNLAREEARHQAESVARNERRFSETMVESMPGILYFYDGEGRFLRWNKNFETVSGYSAEEIATMHPLDFFSEKDKPMLQARIGEVFERGESSVEAAFMSKDGTLKPHFFTGRKVRFNGMDCLVGVGIDITDRKQAESRLAESEQKYRELVELANSIILRWDAEGRITFLNEYGQKFFGYTLEEIIGRQVIDTLVPDTDSEGRDLKSLMQQICANPKAFEHNINENVKRDGELAWVAWTNKFVSDEDGNILEILSIGSDITEQREAELAIQELNATLEQRVIERTEELKTALVRAEAADKIKSAFLATMSHEFRTPLNSIIGFTGIILQGLTGPLNEEQTKQLNMVRGSARHLLELINDVLDISKIEAGQLEVHPQPFDLKESLERVVASVRPMAEKKGLTLSISMAEDIGDMVSDRRRLEQILLNLVNNAIKFTEKGGIHLSVDRTTMRDEERGEAQPAVKFCVKDTGMGIKPEELGALFQAFHQIDSGLTRQYEGTGLGLAICRRLANLLGGDVNATSEWGKGSEFTVILPLHAEAVST
jgi:PAS domain S-box-containing protein